MHIALLYIIFSCLGSHLDLNISVQTRAGFREYLFGNIATLPAAESRVCNDYSNNLPATLQPAN